MSGEMVLFAGFCLSCSVHQLFLTGGALHLLVVDLHKFHHDRSFRGEAVYVWLDILLCRVPGCALLVIATHADKFNGGEEQVEGARSDLEAGINRHLVEKRQEWERAVESMHHGIDVLAVPSLTLCGVIRASGKSSVDLICLRRKTCDVVGTAKDAQGRRLFPNVRQAISVSWARALAMMDALRVGADPAVAAQSIFSPLDSIEGRESCKFVTWENALETWSTVLNTTGLAEEVRVSAQDDENLLQVCCWSADSHMTCSRI